MCMAAIGRVLSVERIGRVMMADVDIAGRVMEIGVDLVPGVEPDMYVVVHAGLALEMLGPEQAADALALRAEIDRAAGS